MKMYTNDALLKWNNVWSFQIAYQHIWNINTDNLLKYKLYKTECVINVQNIHHLYIKTKSIIWGRTFAIKYMHTHTHKFKSYKQREDWFSIIQQCNVVLTISAFNSIFYENKICIVRLHLSHFYQIHHFIFKEVQFLNWFYFNLP